jgi:hypothetical protein
MKQFAGKRNRERVNDRALLLSKCFVSRELGSKRQKGPLEILSFLAAGLRTSHSFAYSFYLVYIQSSWYSAETLLTGTLEKHEPIRGYASGFRGHFRPRSNNATIRHLRASPVRSR